jgi:hypothetical protein
MSRFFFSMFLKCVTTISFWGKLMKFVWLSQTDRDTRLKEPIQVDQEFDSTLKFATSVSWFQSNFYVHRWREGKKPKSHYVMLHPYQLDALHNTNCRVIKHWTDKVKLCNQINTDTKKIRKKKISDFLTYVCWGQRKNDRHFSLRVI